MSDGTELRDADREGLETVMRFSCAVEDEDAGIMEAK